MHLEVLGQTWDVTWLLHDCDMAVKRVYGVNIMVLCVPSQPQHGHLVPGRPRAGMSISHRCLGPASLLGTPIFLLSGWPWCSQLFRYTSSWSGPGQQMESQAINSKQCSCLLRSDQCTSIYTVETCLHLDMLSPFLHSAGLLTGFGHRTLRKRTSAPASPSFRT